MDAMLTGPMGFPPDTYPLLRFPLMELVVMPQLRTIADNGAAK
jgi:hypothetical protein